MQSSNIEHYSSLKKSRLDPNNYTLALLDAGSRLGLLDQARLDRIHTQILQILSELIIKYNRGESTSLKTEKAQKLLISVFYALDACLSSFSQPEEAIDCLQCRSLKEIYADGLEMLEACLAETKKLYQKVMDNKLAVFVEVYNSTLDEGILAFLNKYDIVYSAQDTIITVDYPLLFDNRKIQGVFYIKQYLERLSLETSFCRLFAGRDITQLLADYGRAYEIDYREAIINIFEIVLTNSIFSVLLEGNSGNILISDSQFNLLAEKLKGLDRNICSAILSHAISVLIHELNIIDQQLINYIHDFQPVLLSRLTNALANNSLSNLVIINSPVKLSAEVIWEDGKVMDAESFRILANKILECSCPEEKNALLKSQVKSLADFIDIMEADCFFGNEYQQLFNSLGDLELSLLARIVFAEELRSQPEGFSLQTAAEGVTETEWQIEYADFLHSLPVHRLQSIDEQINSTLQIAGSWSYLK